MRKPLIISAVAAAALVTVVFYAAPFQGTPRPLAGFFPSGAVLYLEAKDFHAELRAWNASEEQRLWLASARYQGFSRSTLFLKLRSAWTEFTGAAGFLPDAAMLDSIAGDQSAVALYDIGNLEFLYVTRIPGASIMQTALYQSRAKYQVRHAGGVDFFVRVDSGRTVAFASAGDYLILGTREELVAGALRLLAGEALTPVAQEAWYADTRSGAGAPGELRLVMNLDALVKSPQFRSYWIQRNASEVRNYRAGIADLVRAQGEIREERVFLRKAPSSAINGNAEALLRLAPENAAFCRAWARPTVDQATALVEFKLLAPKVRPRVSYDYAPNVDTQGGEAGAESDLETRIDEPPLAAQSAIALEDLRHLLASVPLDGALEVQSTNPLPDGVFVETPTVLAVEASTAWDGPAVRNALTAAAASVWTTSASGPGAGWVAHQRGARTWYSMDGLGHLQVAVDGGLLLLANSEEFLGQVLDRIDLRSATSGAASIALFRHISGREDYRRIMSLLDHAQPSGNSRFGFRGQTPAFFSADLWSLSGVFANVREVEVRSKDLGPSLQETVTYRMR